MIPSSRKDAGFSLLELSVIMMIISLMMASALGEYRGYLRTKIANDTAVHGSTVTSALAGFVTNYGRMPCPADPTLKPGDPGGGVEKCISPTPMTGLVVNVPSAYGQCQNYSTASGTYTATGVCRTPGGRMTAANPLYVNNATTFNPKDPVLLGTVPYVTLGISIKDSVDGYNNRMTYAVSEFMTQTARFSYDNGAIDMQVMDPATRLVSSSFNTVTVDGIAGQLKTGAFLYALVSHGQDGKGAYTYQGNIGVACNSSGGYDNENCDGNSSFVSADAKTGIFSPRHTTPVDQYFDDTLTAYSLNKDSDKWSFNSVTTMYNKTLGKVGIGTTAPQYPVDVNGNIKATAYLANNFCNATGANCFQPKIIGAPSTATGAIACTNGIMTGIANSDVACLNAVNTTSITTGLCPAGQYMTGISPTGGIQCALP